MRLEKNRLISVRIPQVFWSIGRTLHRVAWVKGKDRAAANKILDMNVAQQS